MTQEIIRAKKLPRQVTFDTFLLDYKEGRQEVELPLGAIILAVHSSPDTRCSEIAVSYAYAKFINPLNEKRVLELVIVSKSPELEINPGEHLTRIASFNTGHLVEWSYERRCVS